MAAPIRHGLGRIYASDERDKAYPLTLAIPAEIKLPVSKTYRTGAVLDQGDTPRCVAFGSRQWLASYPVPYKSPHPTTDELYAGAQKDDEIPGPPPAYDGSTVRGAAKFLQAQGLLGSYLWAGSVDDIANYILSGKGTVLMGTSWYNDMFNPDSKGVVHVGGGVAGGHCFLCIGYSSRTKLFKFINSWGSGWGLKGKFYISRDDLQTLLADEGEAMAGTETPITPLKLPLAESESAT